MDVFQLRDELIEDYERYVRSFMALRDERIRAKVADSLKDGRLWPEPRIGLNPAFEPGGWVDDLVADGLLHAEAARIFRRGKSTADPGGQPLRLHHHQVEAIRAARSGHNYVLTTGTGSGKSLAYLVPIVDHVLRHGSGRGVVAIVVYPMNALANSQAGELRKFVGLGTNATVTFAKYTGQESIQDRQAILDDPPDIILTNYVMLELILTRVHDRRLVRAAQGLRFLVLDELHTYRGRQGADVALLTRRLREACRASELQCVGTSATLASQGTYTEQREAIARTASLLFGATVQPQAVIGETLRRATPAVEITTSPAKAGLRERVDAGPTAIPQTYEELVDDPLSSWIETRFGVTADGERLVRVRPRAIDGLGGGAEELAALTGADPSRCAEVIRQQLMAGYRIADPETAFPTFAFRLHQFISKGDTVFASPEPEEERHLTLNGQRFVPGDRSRVLLPLAFCRQCGQEYYTATRQAEPQDPGVAQLVPRDLGDHSQAASHRAGFLYLATDGSWPLALDDVHERLPEDWLDESSGTPRPRPDQRH